LFTNSLIFYAKYDQSISISPKFVLKPGFFVGGTLKQDSPPIQHRFGLGGLNEINYISGFVPFYRSTVLYKNFGYYAGIARIKFQYNSL